MFSSGVIVAVFSAFERQSIARERIRRLLSHKLFKNFTARLLRLGHSCQTRIIASLRIHAKGARLLVAAKIRAKIGGLRNGEKNEIER
jgi:hypothetical protein